MPSMRKGKRAANVGRVQMLGEPEEALLKVRERPFKYEYIRDIDVGIWNEDVYDPHKVEKERINSQVKRELEPIKEEIKKLKEELEELKRFSSIPRSFVDDWDNEIDEVWDED